MNRYEEALAQAKRTAASAFVIEQIESGRCLYGFKTMFGMFVIDSAETTTDSLAALIVEQALIGSLQNRAALLMLQPEGTQQ